MQMSNVLTLEGAACIEMRVSLNKGPYVHDDPLEVLMSGQLLTFQRASIRVGRASQQSYSVGRVLSLTVKVKRLRLERSCRGSRVLADDVGGVEVRGANATTEEACSSGDSNPEVLYPTSIKCRSTAVCVACSVLTRKSGIINAAYQ